MWIKRLLFLIPVGIFLLFLGSYWVAAKNFDRKVNQLILSSIGDAEKLNPVLSTDSASSDINGFVFNGLMKYDEEQNLIGDLAVSWTIEQRSRLFLKEDTGLTAADAIDQLQQRMSLSGLGPTGIQSMNAVSDRELEIRLDRAGTAFEDEILRKLPLSKLESIYWIAVSLDPNAALPGGEKNTADLFVGRFQEWLKNRPDLSRSLLEIGPDGSSTVTLLVLGDGEGWVRELNGLLSVEPGNGESSLPLGGVSSLESGYFENNPIITFHLREGVKWHDGEPFTAEDVKFTYEAVMDEKTNTVRRPMFMLVKSMEILGPHLLRVTYKKPFSPSLESWGMGIIPKHLFEGTDINTAPYNRKPVGTGPFRFQEWVSDERITLTANPDYYEGRPHLDRISYRIIPEPPLKELEFFVEGVDADAPQPYQFHRYENDDRFDIYRRLGNNYSYIGWNQKVDLFRDVRVRRALTHAINRQEIVTYLLYDLGVISTGPFPPQMWYANTDLLPLEYNPDLSRKLLKEAGWEDTNGDGILDKDGKPFRFNLITNNGNVLRQNVCVLVQRQLKEIGIQVEISLYEWAVFIRDKINPRDFEACVLGWSLSLDPDVYEIWHSSQIEKGFNFTAYSNPEVDRLIELGRTEYDREKRKEYYRRIHELIHQDQPYTFLYVGEATPALHHDRFRIRRSGPAGEAVEEKIRMTEMGLFYHLNQWFRTGGAALSAA
jgi:peptide/nickel transport system substrate-binding protein